VLVPKVVDASAWLREAASALSEQYPEEREIKGAFLDVKLKKHHIASRPDAREMWEANLSIVGPLECRKIVKSARDSKAVQSPEVFVDLLGRWDAIWGQ